MPRMEETEEMARKVLPIFYVLDTSGSMRGAPIAAVNAAMHETIEVLKEVSVSNPDAEVKVAALQFSSGAQWVTNPNCLEDLEDFIWTDLEAGGMTDLGYAIDELNDKLSRSKFLVSDTGFCIPVIIFMSDGSPTDSWINKLKKANAENKWFKNATKIAIYLGEEQEEQECLARVVGNSEAVISVTDIELLKKLIRVASVTSSMVNSKSRTSADGDAAVEIIRAATNEIGATDSIQIGSGNSTPVEDVQTAPVQTNDNNWDDSDW